MDIITKDLVEKMSGEDETRLVQKFCDKAAKGWLQDGEAPISWEPVAAKRLEEYIDNGFPWAAKVDVCDVIAQCATAALGFLATWLIDRQYGINQIRDRRLSPYLQSGPENTVVKTLLKYDKLKYKGKPLPEGCSPRDLERLENLKACPWWLMARTRYQHGMRYLVTLGDPSYVGSKMSNSHKRVEYYQNHGVVKDCFFDLADDPSAEWFFKRQPSMCVPDMRSPGMPRYTRLAAIKRHGVDTRLKHDFCTEARIEYLKHTGDLTIQHREDDNNWIRLQAMRKFGTRPQDREDEYDSIMMRACLQHGLLDLPIQKQPTRIQRCIIKKEGITDPWLLTSGPRNSVQRAVRARLEQGHQEPSASWVDRLLAGDDDKTGMELCGETYSGTNRYFSLGRLAVLLGVAIDTIAEHPEIALDYQLLLGSQGSDNNMVRDGLKALSSIIQNRSSICKARERRLAALGG